MLSAKSNVFAQPQPTHESAPSWHWPRQLFALDDSAGADKRLEHGPHVLIVEDDFLVATEIEMALTEAGFDVIAGAVTAEQAVELAESQKPALIVMDIRLAGERDGIHAAAEIFQRFGIRCIFATANFDRETRERAKSAMPLGWVQKPFSMASVVGAVRRALKELDRSR